MIREATDKDQPVDPSLLGPNKIAKAKWLKDYVALNDDAKIGEFFQNLAITVSEAAGKESFKWVMEAVFSMRNEGAPPAETAWHIACMAEKSMDRMYGKAK